MGKLTTEQRLDRLAQRLLKTAERSARELDACIVTHRLKEKTEGGELLKEYSEKLPGVCSAVDRGGLKQLTAVLKDLQDILGQDPALDLQEKQLKLRRLEADMSARGGENTVTVMLDSGVEEYAG